MSGNLFSEATKNFILRNRFQDVRKLALSAKSKESDGVDLSEAVIQIAGRQSVEKKLPSWYENDELIYPRHLSLEQCSSEQTARYKASIVLSLVSRRKLVDLTGGFGVDCAFLSEKFESAIYVERQKELCDIAEHNFQSLKLSHIQVKNDDAVGFLNEMSSVDCIYLDPARRDHSGKKIIAISDCEPDLGLLKRALLEKSDCVLVKLSPMLDVSLALRTLTETSEIHVVSVDNECKELLFLLKKDVVDTPNLICVDLKKDGTISSFSFKQQEEKDAQVHYVSNIKKYLFEPNTSILKAGAYKTLALRFGLDKLHVDSHLYTSDTYIPDFPGRVFEIETVTSFNKNELKSAMQGVSQANLSIRNFPMSTDDLKKKLKLRDGGLLYLFATTLNDGKKVLLLCRKT